MNSGLLSFHKTAQVDVLTGRTGAGKTTLADRWRSKYDMVVQTDFERPMNPETGKYDEPTQEQKETIRAARRAAIFKAHTQGKKVLVEGHPPGVVKLFKDRLPEVDRVFHIPVSEKESFKRVIKRAKADPEERSVEIDTDSAKQANRLYDRFLKKITEHHELLPVKDHGGEVKTANLLRGAGSLLTARHLRNKADEERWKASLANKAYKREFPKGFFPLGFSKTGMRIAAEHLMG